MCWWGVIFLLHCSDGQGCFRLTFIICTGVAGLGVLLALALQLMSRLTYARMREGRAAAASAAAASASETAPLLAGGRASS